MKKGLSLLLALLMVVSVFSPAFPSFGGITASAASTFPVELAFENVFVFEDWATNSLSSTVISDGVPNTGGTITMDIENGSFTLTKTDMTAAETYTAFSMGTESASQNEKYYMMDVEPNTEYVFSYHITGNTHLFTPYIFYYDQNGLWIQNGMNAFATPQYETNNMRFTTPANAGKIQVRFTIGDDKNEGNSSATSINATVKNIAIYKAEMFDNYISNQNMFSLEDWANNTSSSTTPSSNLGTVTPNVSDGSIRFVNSGTGYLWTGFGIDANASNDAYYTIDVQGSTSYSLTYDLTDQNLLGPIYCQPFIVEMGSDGKCITYYPNPTAQYLDNKFAFTTQANTVRIQVVFALITDGDNTASAESPRYVTVKNIGVYKTSVLSSDFATVTGHPHRATYSYTTGSADNGTYGELPTVKAPEGQIFAGWYTGKNGTGEYISADTEVSYNSYTVYPKFEPAVDSLTIVTPPTKTTYTIGEKVNTTGLVLRASRTYTVNITDETGNVTTETKTDTYDITSGYRFNPKSLTATGTQTVTVEYGGKTVSYNVTVNDGNSRTILANGTELAVTEANNNYVINFHPSSPFNRYEMTYYSDSYVKGEIIMDGDVEEFFLEPSDNGNFASYIDSFLRGVNHYNIDSISFTCLDKEFGNFELKSVTTISAPIPSDPTQYYQNGEYKVGISLDYGGVVSYIEDLDDDVSAAVYNENGKDITRVDYTSKLPSGAKATSNSVNLINTNDRGRYLQQSYYGTDQPPYEMGDYNGIPWSYNPVQGGNINTFDHETGEVIKGGEASKVIDYRITADQIYVKTRPLDWGKNSEDYPDSYVTDSYMEAWYTFENGMIKTTCRFVDYSGYPSNTTTQEYPALYTIEPLNHFVYNETTEAKAWESASIAWQTEGMKNIEEPDFWGVLPEYNALLKNNGMSEVDVDVDCYENWAAFTASADTDSFGIGVYSAGVTDFHYGVFPAIYNEDQVKAGKLVENYRHAASLDPAIESPTSYISPVGTMTFESYKPSTYSFYVTTGTADQIREDFRKVETIESGEALAKTKVAVPETVYMKPANGASTVGEIYVNNILDSNDFYNVKTRAEREDNMYFGIHIADAAYFTVDVSNATNPANDINLCTTSGSAVSTTQQFTFDPNGNFINDGQYELRFSGTGLNPGEKATAKWDITVTMDDGSTQKYAYYTVMYAPERTVGAVAEARKEDISQNEISSWITGANGVAHSQRSPLGSFHGDYSASGYFKEDPLVYDNPPTTSTGETADDLINVATEYSDNAYVLQTATNGHDHSRAQSYLGLLRVDKSRYTNTDQIPNLEIGYDVLRVGSNAGRSLANYYTFYTLGTSESFTSTDVRERPSDWTSFATTTNSDSAIPVRETVVPSYDVSTIDGKYIHALNQARCWYIMNAGESTGNSMDLNSYATAGTSVLCSVTDKSGLRDSVLTGYGVTNNDPTFVEALEKAGTVLGDPSASQEEIDEAKKDLNNAMEELVDTYYALKYDNLFSAYEFSQHPLSMGVVSNRGTASYANGTLTVVNDVITGGEAYTNYGSANGYYNVDLKPNTEYVFEYDVTTTVKSQAFMFFYNASGGAGDVPTNMSLKTDDGAWTSKTESNPWWGNYQHSAGTKHYAVKFTTGDNTAKAGFRFGNTSNDPTTSTFSNIRLVEASKYYEDATYSKTEETFKEYSSYGAMITPVRPGYTFAGWKDAAGNSVTGATIATEHKTVYSQWNEAQYTVNYNANGGVGEAAAAIVKLTQQFTLPTNFAMDNHVFAGWSYEADGKAVFKPGQTITIADIQADKVNSSNQVTLYAVWEKRYSVYFSQNGGTGEIVASNKAYSEDHILPDSTGITNYGYKFLGWALESTATTPDYYPGAAFNVSKIDASYINEEKQEVILHAVWQKVDGVNVTFDNILDISAWPKTSGNGEVVNVTDTGFTVIANGNGEATCSSAYFPVEVGHKYVVEADIKGNAWDIYFFFCDANGNWVGFSDSGSRLAAGHNQTTNGIHVTSIEFTAPEGAVKAQIRVDANNGGGNAVRFENIRVLDTANRTYLETVNKYVDFADPYGELPVPVKPGQVFQGWVDENGKSVTADMLMEKTDTVYLTSTWTTDANSISNDTVVVEYGLPVVIDIRANDKSGATVNAIGTASIADATLGHTGHPTSKFTGTELDLANGKAVLNADGTITYTLTNTDVKSEEVFYYEVQIDGNYYYAKVTVIPATTLYFEDTFFTFKDSTVTKNGVEYNYNWEEVGTSVGEVFQDADRPGAFNFKDDANNVYGYDNNFDNKVAYSGGTAHYVEVDQIAGTGAPTATFTFTGTGFDLFTATDSKAGMLTVTIYRGNKVDSANRVKGVIANAYFGYGYDAELDDYFTTDNGAIFQVPILRERNLGYGTYTVVVQPRYNKSYDVANTGLSGVYVDSVRIFDPMGTDNTVANEAYKADGEYAPQYLEIRDTLITPKLENGIYTGEYDFSVLENNKSVFLDGGRTSLADFAKLGPKNEVYLQAGDAVAFDIVTNSPVLPSTVQLGMGLTGNGGNSATVTLMNANYNGWKEDITLNSTAERYYNIESVVDWVLQDDGTYKTASPVIITNTSGGIIALTSLKWAFNQDIATTKLALIADENTPVLVKAAINRMLNPEPENTVIAKENIAYSFSSESYAIGEAGTLTISTEHGVAGVTVNGAEVVNCEAVENGKLNWTFEFTADVAGEVTYEIVARDESGNTSETVYATTYVQGIEGDEDPVEPDDGIVDDGEDDTTGDVGSDNLTPDSFVKNLLNGIFNILGKLFGLLLGGATI